VDHEDAVVEEDPFLARVSLDVGGPQPLDPESLLGRVGNGDYGVALAYCTVLIVAMSLATALIQALVGERQLARRAAPA